MYHTNLFVKLLSLSLVKFATLDPYGMGIEMEGNKPGWNDAMNGLPGLFGSGMSETVELTRIVKFVLQSAAELPDQMVAVPKEMSTLLQKVAGYLTQNLSGELTEFDYWDQVVV